MTGHAVKYAINLSFEEIKLPPFQDILILGKNAPQGKIGLSKSFELLVPNGFTVVEVDDERVEAIFVHKRILKKIDQERVLRILEEKVFPFISEGELLRVDFKISISYSAIEEKGTSNDH